MFSMKTCNSAALTHNKRTFVRQCGLNASANVGNTQLRLRIVYIQFSDQQLWVISICCSVSVTERLFGELHC